MNPINTDQTTNQTNEASLVIIPGRLYAEYDPTTGAITRWSFMPAAGDAGYFGPAAVLWDGDADLDIESDDGEFWTAVTTSLANPLVYTDAGTGTFAVEWTN
jgi:hypothetical protein